MKKSILAAILFAALTGTVTAGEMVDDPLLVWVMVNEAEVAPTDGADSLSLDAEAWVGYDLNKLWFKTTAEHADGDTEDAEVQLVYSRAIARYWDFQAGWRRNMAPGPDRDWGSIGLKGLAPYFFEVDAEFFVGERGRVAARLDIEYEVLFTQKLIMTPEIEVNIFSKDDAAVRSGSGVSDLELGLRLRYEIRREFAPYIGVNWLKQFGHTADFTRADGGDSSDVQFVAGVRAWF
jgi:copper resistance protein B